MPRKRAVASPLSSLPKKRIAALFKSSVSKEHIARFALVKDGRFILIKYTCLESIQSFVLSVHAKKAYIHTYLIEYAC